MRIFPAIAILVFGTVFPRGAPQRQEDFKAYARSLEMARKELARRPDSPALLGVLAGVHERSGNYGAAIEVLSDAVSKHPRRADLQLRLGSCNLGKLDYLAAVEANTRAVSLTPREKSAPARLSLARALAGLGKHAEAVRELKLVIELGLESAQVFYSLAEAQDGLARSLRGPGGAPEAVALDKEAIAALEKAIRFDPAHRSANYLLGRLLLRSGRKEEGKKKLERFRALQRSNEEGKRQAFSEKMERSSSRLEADTALALARVCRELQEMDAALGFVDRALAVYAGYDKALALKGSIYKRSGRATEAAAAYSELLSSSPGHPEALWNLGLLELARKRLGPALELLERAAHARKSAEAWEFLRSIASREKSLQGRRVEFSREALRLRPSPENYFQCGVSLIESGDRKGCLELLREGIRRHPADSRLKVFYSQAQGAPGGGG